MSFEIVPAVLSPALSAMLVEEAAHLRAIDGRRDESTGRRFLTLDTRKLVQGALLAAVRRVAGDAWDRIRFAVFDNAHDGDTDPSSHFVYPRSLRVWVPLAAGTVHVSPGTRPAARLLTVRGRPRLLDLETDELVDPPALAPVTLAAVDALVMSRETLAAPSAMTLSCCAVSSRTIVTREELTAMGAAKFDVVARMRAYYAKRLAAFDIARREALPLDEYDRLFSALDERERLLRKQLGVATLNNYQLDDLILDLTRSPP